MSKKFKPQHNETILSFQYFKLRSKIKESGQKCMDSRVTDCKYQECDGRLKEQFINDLNDQTIITEIITE